MAESLAASERKAYKAHIKSLEEQLAWVRSFVSGPATLPVQADPIPPLELYDSEEVEDAKEMLEAGIIDQEEYANILEATGAMSTDIDFHPTT